MERHFKGTQPHITIDKIEAEIAFLPGPPERALEIAEKFSSYEKVTEQREFVTHTGEIEGKNVCVTSTGIRCPSAAIVAEELAICGVKTFIRVGTTGAIQDFEMECSVAKLRGLNVGAVLAVLYFFLTASINLLPNLITSFAPFTPFTAVSSSYSASK